MQDRLSLLGSTGATTKWLVLVALVWTQFALAEHQFEHDAADTGHDCSFCAQFDRDVMPGGDDCRGIQHEYTDSVDVVETAPPPATAFSHYQSRASP